MLKHEKNVRKLIGSVEKKNFPSRGPETNVFFFWDFPRVLQNHSRPILTLYLLLHDLYIKIKIFNYNFNKPNLKFKVYCLVTAKKLMKNHLT